jgi:prepilin-type processing-associated H-X9-DG protein
LSVLKRYSGCFILGGIAVVLLSVLFAIATDMGLKSAAPVRSEHNLAQIGHAIRLYADSHHGEFPDSLRTLVLNEDLSSDLFISPSRDETPARGTTKESLADELESGNHLSYVYVGRGLTTDDADVMTVVAYEMPYGDQNASNILFGDGHVEFFEGASVARIIDLAHSGKFPVTMPSP